MRISKLLSLILLVPATVYAGEKLEPLNVKPGLWEVTYTTYFQGPTSLPENEAAGLTPEQRARVEQMLKARAAKNGQSRVKKRCVTEEQLKKDAFADERTSCKRTVMASSSDEMNFREECSEEGNKIVTTYNIKAMDKEHVKGEITHERSSGQNVKGNFTAKWVGAACGEIK